MGKGVSYTQVIGDRHNARTKTSYRIGLLA